MKKALSQRVFWEMLFFLLHSKFSQAECIYKCCPTQPLEMKGLPFPRRHAFYCQGGAWCPCMVVPQRCQLCFAVCIRHRGCKEKAWSETWQSQHVFVEDPAVGEPWFLLPVECRWKTVQTYTGSFHSQTSEPRKADVRERAGLSAIRWDW